MAIFTLIWTTPKFSTAKATYAPYKSHAECNRVENFLGWVYQVVTGRRE